MTRVAVKVRRWDWWSHSFPERSFTLYSMLFSATLWAPLCPHAPNSPLKKKNQPKKNLAPSSTMKSSESAPPSSLHPPPGEIQAPLLKPSTHFIAPCRNRMGWGLGEKRGNQKKAAGNCRKWHFWTHRLLLVFCLKRLHVWFFIHLCESLLFSSSALWIKFSGALISPSTPLFFACLGLELDGCLTVLP